MLEFRYEKPHEVFTSKSMVYWDVIPEKNGDDDWKKGDKYYIVLDPEFSKEKISMELTFKSDGTFGKNYLKEVIKPGALVPFQYKDPSLGIYLESPPEAKII